ncbi:hypothetical protein P153DRAFT_360833 [Dothidotthia symphoricarpi CBS 119687]|uniref:F-box domain-containing protein n=1 Tax=Dothidotthia symphoricarpi CBS 119687 TaxID=1392245 RepID=A0A6A5ZYL1_9PLEO|nr:uncharacterized protein P153DRAFT_360833 [Dothidotthia symphoricarpi CBS 119687]KAF2124629.1 hypothetical protein P153DRAFT_360833 [Dothidotthia symphoricarpi CBS 119687]
MKYLPPELHYEVCEYLSLEDIRRYRLVNKTFSHVGAAKLFRQLTFHASDESLNQVCAVAAHPVLRKQVKSLIWDANLWDIGTYGSSFEEFRNYTSDHSRSGLQEMEHKLARQLNVSRDQLVLEHQSEVESEVQRHYGLYQARRIDEQRVLRERLTAICLRPILRRFLGMEKISIHNGDYYKWCPKRWPDYYWGGDHVLPETKATELLARGEGAWQDNLGSGLPVWHPFEHSIIAVGHQLKELVVDHLSWKTFQSEFRVSMLARHCPGLVSLKLAVAVEAGYGTKIEVNNSGQCRSIMKNGQLAGFIAGLSKLQVLEIRFPYYARTYVAAVELSDIIPADQTGLRRLVLERFETSEAHISKLLRSNRKTLKDLSLQDIYLNPRGSWTRIFKMIRNRLSLTSAQFDGVLCDSVRPNVPLDRFNHRAGVEDGWDFMWYSDEGEDERLGYALSDYLVKGPVCPLTYDMKIAVQKGRKELVAEP